MPKVHIQSREGEDATWVLTTSFQVPKPPEETFAFFADAENLERITPRWLRFRILTPRPIEMTAGTLIDYRLRISGWPVRWRTAITEWDPPFRFVDTQIEGPYRRWVHEHIFTPIVNGTRVDDRVTYCVPGGRIVHAIYVKRALRRIFENRRERLRELLGGESGDPRTGGSPAACASGAE